MNAGTQTGSLVNHLYSRMTIGEPEPTESQEYEYATVMDGHRYYYRKDKKGQWRKCYHNENGRLIYGTGGLSIGHRESYYDFSF